MWWLSIDVQPVALCCHKEVAKAKNKTTFSVSGLSENISKYGDPKLKSPTYHSMRNLFYWLLSKFHPNWMKKNVEGLLIGRGPIMLSPITYWDEPEIRVRCFLNLALQKTSQHSRLCNLYFVEVDVLSQQIKQV